MGGFPSRGARAVVFALSTTLVVSLTSLTFFEMTEDPLLGPSNETTERSGDYSVAVGDGHMHTIYSNGVTTIHNNSDVAKARSLDWIFITDHNAMGPQSECEAESTVDFKCFVGEEVTTMDGHILGWGIDSLVPWNLGTRTMDDIFEDIRKQGGLAILAHPLYPDPPDRYQHFGVYDNFDGMEIYHGYAGFNAGFPTTMDIDALVKWEEYLNAGWRKIAVGDSDSHDGFSDWDQGDLLNRRGAIGFPRNVVLVEELSLRGLLEAVSKGRLYVTDGPTLNFTINGHVLGDTIRSSAATLTVNISGYANESSTVRLIANGTVTNTWAEGPGWFNISEPVLADSDKWLRAEIRTFNGNFLSGETYVAFTNPIYFDLQPYDLPPTPPTNLMAELSGSDVFLSWDASPSADIDHYHVYVSDSYDMDFLYPAGRTVGTNWTHTGAGIGDTSDYFYVVRAVDRMGYEENNTAKAAKTSRHLLSGKHLMSYPLLPANDSLLSILQTVDFSSVWTYDSSGWAEYSPLKGYSGLATMTNRRGYWLNVSQDCYFVMAGAVPQTVKVDLVEGWNLVSYPSFVNTSVSDLMVTLPVTRVEGPFDGPPYHLRLYTLADELTSFDGYWLHLSESATWTVTG